MGYTHSLSSRWHLVYGLLVVLGRPLPNARLISSNITWRCYFVYASVVHVSEINMPNFSIIIYPRCNLSKKKCKGVSKVTSGKSCGISSNGVDKVPMVIPGWEPEGLPEFPWLWSMPDWLWQKDGRYGEAISVRNISYDGTVSCCNWVKHLGRVWIV